MRVTKRPATGTFVDLVLDGEKFERIDFDAIVIGDAGPNSVLRFRFNGAPIPATYLITSGNGAGGAGVLSSGGQSLVSAKFFLAVGKPRGCLFQTSRIQAGVLSDCAFGWFSWDIDLTTPIHSIGLDLDGRNFQPGSVLTARSIKV